eukprot:m.107671 g.107671  ORF g.107671 m.107671 type:complete len:171 (-) comp22591_c0_seq1:206-718(-)
MFQRKISMACPPFCLQQRMAMLMFVVGCWCTEVQADPKKVGMACTLLSLDTKQQDTHTHTYTHSLIYLLTHSLTLIHIDTHTPTQTHAQDLTHTIFCEPKIPTFIAKIFMLGEARQVERDVMVWNNKTYQKKPLLVPEDSLIAKHRRWYSQFYSENSPTFSFMMKKSLAW